MTKLPTIEEVLTELTSRVEPDDDGHSQYDDNSEQLRARTDALKEVRQQLSAIIRDIIGEDFPESGNLDHNIQASNVYNNSLIAKQRQKAKQYGVDLEEKE